MQTPSPAAIQQAISLGQIIVALLPLAVLVQIGIAIWAARRKPSITEELYRDFVTRAACDARHCREDTTRQNFHQQLSERLKKGDELFRAVERTLGRIEGTLESLKSKGIIQ